MCKIRNVYNRKESVHTESANYPDLRVKLARMRGKCNYQHGHDKKKKLPYWRLFHRPDKTAKITSVNITKYRYDSRRCLPALASSNESKFKELLLVLSERWKYVNSKTETPINSIQICRRSYFLNLFYYILFPNNAILYL